MTIITSQVVSEHGLTEEEYQKIKDILGREPNITELGIFSVMWSEHCSYKSSKKWLKILPTKAPWVVCGPGENAGIVDIGDGQSAVFKMESHNHPSFIEPYQGAATGVGGILRDVFTMGARPIAIMNSLRFGDPNHPRTKYLVSGVVQGIGGYGNCVGVPTVGGECNFHSSYNGNILVNAMTVGIAETNKIVYSAATGIGNSLVYVGSKTGRDGIHGATMASSEFKQDADEKRPTVQVGDPFTEKLLIEACLELMSTGAVLAIQDMGAAGLTSSAFEMASKGGVGIELNIDKVPAREGQMTAYDFLLSESQERMLMVLKPGSEAESEKIFEKWELDFSIVGRLTENGRMVVFANDEVVADLPIDPLAKAAPEYDRPWVKTKPQKFVKLKKSDNQKTLFEVLKLLMGSPDLASKRWIWEQYDYLVMGNTVCPPGGDAAVVRVENSQKAIAITTDCTPRYCLADPMEGGKQAVAEAWRNLNCVGATPLAITDNLNFGNPENPQIMGQLVAAIKGIREACEILQFPVVSGNVSLYNETSGEAILPTPAIGGIGIIPDLKNIVGMGFRGEGEEVFVLGSTIGHIGQSLFLRECEFKEEGAPPPVDTIMEKKVGDFVRGQIMAGTISACHDSSDGGLLVAVAEMALASDIGLVFDKYAGILPIYSWAFGEDQGRYVVATRKSDALMQSANSAKVQIERIGITGGRSLVLEEDSLDIIELRNIHEKWFPNFMEK